MRLMSLKEYPDYKPDIEFKSPWVDRLLVTLVVVIAGLALLIAPHYPIFGKKLPAWWCYLTGGLLALMRLLSLSAFRKSLRPTNWLLRASGTRQWIKFRTFLNDHLPVDELQIIELDRDEIAWVRSVKIKTVYLTGPGDGRSNTHQTIKFLDIGLKHCDTDLLDAQLRIEEHHKGAGNHGIGSKSNNYPVSVPEPGVIRLLWSDQYGRIAPSVELAIQYFATWIRTRDPENLAVDYRPGAIANLPEIEQRRRMRELNRIDCFAANHLVQELRKCSLNESLRFLQEV